MDTTTKTLEQLINELYADTDYYAALDADWQENGYSVTLTEEDGEGRSVIDL